MDGHDNGGAAALAYPDGSVALVTGGLPDDLHRLSIVVQNLDAMDDDERTRALAFIAARFKRPAPGARRQTRR